MFVLEPDTDILDDRHNSEISENHGYRQSWKQSWHCKSSVNDRRNMMASECHFCLSVWVQLTEVIPILLHVLDLQLVAALGKDGFRVLLKPSGQDSSMPGPSVDPSVHVYHHYKHTTHSAATHTCCTDWTNHTYHHHLKYAKPESATEGDFTRRHDDVRRCSKSGVVSVAKWELINVTNEIH